MSPQRGGDREFFHRLAPPEECFDLLACVGLRRFGQMQVEHGGRQRRVTHVLLNRFDRHARATALRGAGWSNKQIARELGVHGSTVGRWFAAAHLPDTNENAADEREETIS